MNNDTMSMEMPMDYMMPPPQQNMGFMPQMPVQDANIASMRWEGQAIISELYRILGGYDVKTDKDGNIRYERKNAKIPPKINDVGLEAMASILQSTVNPVVSLTKLTEEDANELIRQKLYDIAEILVICQQDYDIKDADLTHIHDIMKTLIYCQIKRAVDGHESRNFRTQTMEQNTTMNQAGAPKGGLWNSLFGRRG